MGEPAFIRDHRHSMVIVVTEERTYTPQFTPTEFNKYTTLVETGEMPVTQSEEV